MMVVKPDSATAESNLTKKQNLSSENIMKKLKNIFFLLRGDLEYGERVPELRDRLQ